MNFIDINNHTKNKYKLNLWKKYGNICYKLNKKSLKSINCCFDYDETLASLRTSDPKKNVVEILNKLSLKYNIIIFSNQKGVSIGKTTNTEVQKLIDDFCTKINIPISIFYSTTDDENRKPMIGMFNFAKKLFEKTKFKYYCGDAAGRQGDFSISDLYFANNAGIKFKTPEEVFNNQKNIQIATKKIKDLYKDDLWLKGKLTNKRIILKYYTLNDIEDKLPSFNINKYKYLIIIIGSQGSGKSTLAEFLSEKYNFGIINRDQLKTQSKMNKAFLKFKDSKKGIVIDNTNATKKNRDLWTNKLKNDKDWKIIKIFINIPKILSFHLTKYRLLFNGKKIPSVAIHSFYKKLEIGNKGGYVIFNKPIIKHKFNQNMRFVWR
jgi:bifunctional polynucleotide phosphatase/kinase